MNIVINELSIEQINTALLRITRAIQNNTNNFQNDVEKAVANVTINSKNTVQRYDDSYLMSIVTDIRDKYKDLVKTDQDILRSIINLETILANVSLNYDEVGNVITFNLGDYSTSFTLKDTTYTFSYDTETGHFTIVDNVTGETVFEETFNDTTYTFSFANGILTIHNNLLDTDQTFNFDERYYTEAEIQSLILDKIPPEASASNQLADKSFVNSSISTATATFRGTVTTTQALAALTGDLNDYAYLQNIDPTTGQTLSYDRYKWVESGGDYGHWKYEYTLNNSSFTSDQWAAINSGITCQIVQDLLDGCYSGNGSALCKSAGNEWRSLLSTNCNCTGSVDADYIYYNTNIQANQCTGALLANCYCVKDHGLATFAAQGITAPGIGLTAGCTYPLTCILESIMACCGYNAGTYTFVYADAANPVVQETGGYAYLASFTKEDSANPVINTWSMTRWTVKVTNGTIYTARAYSASSPGIAGWTVSRTGNVTGGSFNGVAGTVSDGCLSFSNINFDNICNSTSKCVAANNITRRYLITNQISSAGYITRWGLGLERGTTGWGTGLLSLGVKDDGTCFADYKFTCAGSISLTCCGTAKCITLEGCATKNVFTCCLGSVNNTRRYFQIKTKANRGSCSVSFDFDFFSMNGTINLDRKTQEYTGTCYAGLQVSRCDYTCTCCDCFWLTYTGYRTLTLKSVYDFEVLCNTTTAPAGVTFSNLSYRLGAVCKVAADQNTSYNLLMSSDSNDTQITTLGAANGLTYNPSTGILNVTNGTCIGWYRTKSICVKVTPTAQSSCWIYIGRLTNTYNELNLTIAAVGTGMVSSANIKVLSASAISPTVIVQRQAGYSTSTGIDCVAVTRSGSVWDCYVCVWARVKSNGTCPYYVHLYRNMLPDSWSTALTVCSAITGDVVGVGNAGINSRTTQSNADLRIGSLTACTSSVVGCGGSIFGSGYLELFAPTPFIDFHVNNSGADCSSRIIANTGSLGFNVNNATGCTASTQASSFYMCSNGLLYSGRGFVAGSVNAGCPFVYIDCGCDGRMISMTRATGGDVGLLLAHCADWAGSTYCNLGIDVGSGNINRGFYHCKAGTFEWLQYWDATCERHNCPQCFACPIYGCSSATFAGMVSSCNTERWSTVYSSDTYNTGYYLIAEYKTCENGFGNHDITIGGCVDIAGTSACKSMRFKATIRGNKCTVNFAQAWVDSSLAADCLVFTRSVDTATCTFDLRIYGKISSYYTRFNTTIDYLAAGDVNLRKSNQSGCLTFPNTYAANTSAFVGTLITPICSCGQITADSYKTQALYICCSFPANSTSYILLGCYKPSNLANVSNELNLGFAAGGYDLVEKGSLKLLLTIGNGSCFCNNNIDVKMSNYLIGPNQPGVCAVGFTSSGNLWNCMIGVWLAVRNTCSAARTWAIDLLRNKVDNCWESCMTCTTTMPTFVCTVQVPSTQNFHFNNAYSMINQWSYETCATQTACMRYATLVIGQVNCVRKPTHQKFLVTTTITGSENPLNMWIEYMGGYGNKDFLQACYSGGNCNVIIPMRIGSDSENIYVDFAVCCSASRTICSDVYSSGNMQLGSKGNALRSYPYTLCYAPQENVYTCVMCQWPTTIIFNVDDPASQFATRVIAANTISAYCMATTSDVRQKKDIVPYNNGLCDIKNLDIISFRYKSEDDKAIKHISVPANWTCQLISGKNQDQFRVNDTVGILLSAVKDLSKSMTLMQKIKLWFYKKFIEPRNNKRINDKLESFN